MFRTSLVLAAVIKIIACSGHVDGESFKSIPLSDMWAYNMPGTKNVRDLEAEPKNAPRVNQILTSLMMKSELQPDTPDTAFVVLGNGNEALDNVYAVFVTGEKPASVFPTGRELSLVFFSRSCSALVELKSVTRNSNNVEVQYAFVPRREKELSQHFSIIPLDDLPRGNITVEVLWADTNRDFARFRRKPIDKASARLIVSGSFSFTIETTTKVN
jgi:hypothetical protein